ncbi:MAG: nuclear transport factor 2 family protein [Bacteroidales bacterium]|nr:nuclear transport factor 2 family protein [Bacteroidales bacterium]
MTQNHFILDMYRAIDAKSSVGMCNFLTEDASFRFANMPAVEGKDNIITFLDGFFSSIKAIQHTDIEYWNSGNAWTVSGNVTYTRHNDSRLRVPFAVILKMNGDLVREFLIFGDMSELYSS